jgi:hypothetical protein
MKTERTDFQRLSDGKVIVNKMHRSEDKRRDIVHSSEVKDNDFDLDDALAWCEANGYTVLWWWDEHKRKCARAFLGEPWPIRTVHQIRLKRNEVEAIWLRDFRANPGKRSPIEKLQQVDLAFAG